MDKPAILDRSYIIHIKCLASFHEFSTMLTFHLHQQIMGVYDCIGKMENPTCLL